MANLITSLRTYKTAAAAQKCLAAVLATAHMSLTKERWLIAVSAQDEERFVPTLVGIQYAQFAHQGIMVVS